MIHMSVIPPEILLDRRRKVAMGVQLPKGSVELPDRGPWRTWPGMVASTAVHVGLFLAAAGLLSSDGTAELQSAEPESQSHREVAMVYLEPPPAPQPTPEEQPPQPEPQAPVETTPPSQQALPPPGPESDDVLSPAPARETNSATREAAPDEAASEARSGSDERDNVISTERVIEDGAEDLASAVAEKGARPTIEEEARRIFGRPTTGTGTRNNALPWASDSTCVPDPTPTDPNAPVVLDSIVGVVYDNSGIPLTGAHLQVVGTSYHTFSDGGGRYSLVFDVSLVANCRVQVVRVSAAGYRGRDLYLAIGLGDNNVYMQR